MGNCTRAMLGIASFRLASLVRATEQAVPGKAAGVPGYELHEKWYGNSDRAGKRHLWGLKRPPTHPVFQAQLTA